VKTREILKSRTSAAFDLKRILVPVDFSAASNNAVEHARRLGAFTGAELIFLHVVVPDAPFGCADLPAICSNQLKENAEENLRRLARTARNGGDQSAQSLVRWGLPAHEVVEEAQDSDVDLIVIATHGYTGWKHFCIGSTAEKVVRAAPCPVLVVREKEHEFA
jgi:nucleotide-binding universal stress UspA family protein